MSSNSTRIIDQSNLSPSRVDRLMTCRELRDNITRHVKMSILKWPIIGMPQQCLYWIVLNRKKRRMVILEYAIEMNSRAPTIGRLFHTFPWRTYWSYRQCYLKQTTENDVNIHVLARLAIQFVMYKIWKKIYFDITQIRIRTGGRKKNKIATKTFCRRKFWVNIWKLLNISKHAPR